MKNGGTLTAKTRPGTAETLQPRWRNLSYYKVLRLRIKCLEFQLQIRTQRQIRWRDACLAATLESFNHIYCRFWFLKQTEVFIFMYKFITDQHVFSMLIRRRTEEGVCDTMRFIRISWESSTGESESYREVGADWTRESVSGDDEGNASNCRVTQRLHRADRCSAPLSFSVFPLL